MSFESKRNDQWRGIVAHACIISLGGIGQKQIKASLSKKLVRPPYLTNWVWRPMPEILAMQEAEVGR
jgi:hypothetical protein